MNSNLSITLRGLACLLLLAALAGCTSSGTRPDGAPGDAVTDVSDGDEAGLFNLQREADKAYDEGRLLDAEQLYRRMLKATPASGHAWLRLGNVQLRNDQLEAAVHAYRECLRFETGQSRCWQNLALTYVEMAVATLDQADLKADDIVFKERMAAFKRRLIESVNVESSTAR